MCKGLIAQNGHNTLIDPTRSPPVRSLRFDNLGDPPLSQYPLPLPLPTLSPTLDPTTLHNLFIANTLPPLNRFPTRPQAHL